MREAPVVQAVPEEQVVQAALVERVVPEVPVEQAVQPAVRGPIRHFWRAR